MKEENTFIKYLQKKDFTESTQNRYLNSANKFLNWYACEKFTLSNAEVMNCTKTDILKYLEYLKKNRSQSNHSRNCELISIKHYFAFMLENNQITSNPTALIKIRGTKKKQLYNIFTPEELTQLADDYYINYIRNFDNSKIPQSTRYKNELGSQRNYLILTFLVYQGLHTNEIQKIQVSDIDFKKATVKIQGSRRTNERILPLRAEQIGFLMNYLQNTRPLFLDHYKEESEQLFLLSPENGENRSVSTNYSSVIYTLLNQVVTINANFLNFKQIRTSVIAHWIKTAGLRKAQYMAGHRFISSTEKYLPNNIEALKDDITKYNPF